MQSVMQSMSSLFRQASRLDTSSFLKSGTNQAVRFASKKAKGASKNGRKTIGRRLGPKVMDGEYVEIGNIIMRQRGTKIMPGMDVGCGRDHTLYALAPGIVRFCSAPPKEGRKRGKVFARVEPAPPHRFPSIEKKLRRLAIQRYNGPVLHAPR